MKIMKFGQIMFLSKTQFFWCIYINETMDMSILNFPKLGLRKEIQTKVMNSPHNIKTLKKNAPAKSDNFKHNDISAAIFFASLVLV